MLPVTWCGVAVSTSCRPEYTSQKLGLVVQSMRYKYRYIDVDVDVDVDIYTVLDCGQLAGKRQRESALPPA